jgi:sphingomyelin phosphodiesterase acid-like 3
MGYLMTKKILYLFSLLLVFSSYAWAELPSPSVEKFITVADIHFDPFFACKKLPKPCSVITKLRAANSQQWDTILASGTDKPAGFAEDTNYSLWQLTVTELKKANQADNPQFVLILGDFLAHSFHDKYIKYSRDKSERGYILFVKKTLQFLMNQLNQIFPTVSVYSVVGNNDTYTENYHVVSNGEFLKDTAITWSTGIKNKNNQNQFFQTFPQYGYYTITLPYHQKILVLNTVLFSSKSTKDMDIAANNQLRWLKQQLLSSQKDHLHVLIVCHIPMSIDAVTSIKLYVLSVGGEFWKPLYKNEFKKIIQSFSSTIVAILPAHIHMDAYQLMPVANIPIIFTPSISPIYGNSTGFKVFTYDPDTLDIKDHITYSFGN